MLSLDVVVSDICHCDRICNTCAHELPRYGDPDQPMLWLEFCWFAISLNREQYKERAV
jgi:hypothetical protein